MNLPKNGKSVLDLLNKNGFEAYAVGGFVRDMLMGKTPGDFDITTSALPDETENILRQNNIKYIETGLKHGTITAVFDGEPIEITTFRADGEYKDNRRPETVSFVRDIKEDLSRRDFTVNAMAYNEKNGVVDLFGGQQDIEDKIIRCVGDADTRFKEDALRIMRALRFSAVLGFTIEENTKKAILNNKELLLNVASERIFTELYKMLKGENIYNVLNEYQQVIAVIIPELVPAMHCEQNNPWHIYNVYQHIINAVESAPPDSDLRLVMLLHDIGKPAVKTTDSSGKDHFKFHAKKSAEIAEKVLRRFHASNKIINKVTQLVFYHQSVENVDDIRVKRWLAKIGAEQTENLFKVRMADLLAHNPEKIDYEYHKFEELLEELNKIVEADEAFSVKDLAVHGNDLIALGFKGKEIGEKLNEILMLVIEDKLKNDKQAILSYLTD